MPLAGGDSPVGVAQVGGRQPLTHLPVGDPLRGYAEDLAVPELAERELRGFLNGSIDLVGRTSTTAHRATSSSTTRPTGSVAAPP